MLIVLKMLKIRKITLLLMLIAFTKSSRNRQWDFLIDVNKPKEESTIPKENLYEPTDPSQARGTITESVGADNREYPRRSEITDAIR